MNTNYIKNIYQLNSDKSYMYQNSSWLFPNVTSSDVAKSRFKYIDALEKCTDKHVLYHLSARQMRRFSSCN